MKRRPATGEIEFNPEPLHRRNSGYTAPHRHYQLGAAKRADRDSEFKFMARPTNSWRP
jgi:hypothetical protein